MVVALAWKRMGFLAALLPALFGCGSEPLESSEGSEPGEGSSEVGTTETAALPTFAEQLDAVVSYCTRLSNFCADFQPGLCAEVQVSLLPEEGHRCHVPVVRRTMCLTSLAMDQLECTSRFAATPKPGFCEEERATASACYEHL